MPATPRPRWWTCDLGGLPPRLRRHITLTVAAAAAVVAGSAGWAWWDGSADTAGVLAVLGLFTATTVLPDLELHRGGQRHVYRFGEFPALLGLAVAPGYLMPVAALAAEAALLARRRLRRGDPPPARFKALFSAAVTVVGTAVLVLAADPGRPWTYPVAAVAAAAVSDLLIRRAVHLAGGPPLTEALRGGWPTRLGIPALVAVLAAAAAALPGGGLAAAGVPTAAMVAWWAGATWVRAARDRDLWRRMDAVSRALVGEFDEQAIIRTALFAAQAMFNPTRVDLTLTGGVVSHVLTDGIGAQPTTRPHRPAGGGDPRTVVVPLAARSHQVGVLALRFPRTPPHSVRAGEMVSTFAHTVAANLLAARVHDQVRRAAATAAHQATHDPLTGLGNRVMLHRQAPPVLAAATAAGRCAALLLLDLDGFKAVNDTLGHAAGDRLLTQVGARLAAAVRGGDLAVRLGGDEFAVLAEVPTAADAERLAHHLTARLSPPILVDGLRLSVEASIGVAVAGVDAGDIGELLQAADVAMYQAKATGTGVCRYQRRRDPHHPERLALATDLRRALGAPGELVVHYQPQVDLRTGAVAGMEALVRWAHPTLGLLGPDQFVPLAEHSGLIRRFTLTVLAAAVAQHARIRGHRHAPPTVSVNLSARNLLDQGLPAAVHRILAEHAVSPTELVLEVTETAPVADGAAAERVLAALAAGGCQISQDDFGTGYAALATLRGNRPLHEIKIDRGFVTDLAARPAASTLVSCLAHMARARGCRVVAEGVENAALLHQLRDLGADLAQGFHLARPLPADRVTGWLDGWPARRRRLYLPAAAGPMPMPVLAAAHPHR